MELTATDILPLVRKLSDTEREKLLRAVAETPRAEPVPEPAFSDFRDALLAMPDVGDDADFERGPAAMREIPLCDT